MIVNEMPLGEALAKLGALDPKEIGVLLNDSSEWNLLGNAYADMMLVGKFVSPTTFGIMVVGMIQAAYYLGYKRGKAEKTMPIFMVGEDLTE